METICMKRQILFSRENKENNVICVVCWIKQESGKG